MGFGSKLYSRVKASYHEKQTERKEQQAKRRELDREAKEVERMHYEDAYKKEKLKLAHESGRARGKSAARGSSRIGNLQSGINFLSQDTFGIGQASGPQISSNINSLLGFGSTAKKTVNRNKKGPKGKYTTIRTNGQTITIREKIDDEQNKKKQKTVADNINELLGF